MVSFSGKSALTQAPRTEAQRIFDESFTEALHIDARKHRPFVTPGVASPTVDAVSIQSLRKEFYKRSATGQDDPAKRAEAQRKAFNRALKEACAKRGYQTETIEGKPELIWRVHP